ncbi:MAG TPA: helix-turn-helix domain-containing protein [Solirubrobacterales bacterium]|nr:helix-turn-helix domain-containing protein [Solirubrobacterales bacterium]
MRPVLRARLEARREEIEAAALARVGSIGEPDEHKDSTYTAGLRTAVLAALDYALDAIGQSGGQTPPVPAALLAQARLAARRGIGLDTVLRRYFAGYSLLGYFLIDEASKDGLSGPALQRLAGNQAGNFDRLLVAVSEEHERETERRLETAEQRRAELVRRLLDGELREDGRLGYELDGHHVGIVTCGHGAGPVLREIAYGLDRRLLLVHPEANTAWAWLGGRRAADRGEVEQLRSAPWPDGVAVALGEPGEGPSGWRLTHRQAVAALPVALRGRMSFVRHAEVALLTACLRDDLLATSLRESYLQPLEDEGDRGAVAQETLRAYFAAGCNVSSAAAALGVNRSTVSSRLRSVEQRLGGPLDSNRAELEVALDLAELAAAPPAPHPAGK